MDNNSVSNNNVWKTPGPYFDCQNSHGHAKDLLRNLQTVRVRAHKRARQPRRRLQTIDCRHFNKLNATEVSCGKLNATEVSCCKFNTTEVSCGVAVFIWGYSWKRFEVYFFMDYLTLKTEALPSIQAPGTSKPKDTEDLNLHGLRYEDFRFRKADIDNRILINPLTPNDPYRGRTAPLTCKVTFYIFIQEIQVLNILNVVYTLRFFLFKLQFVS